MKTARGQHSSHPAPSRRSRGNHVSFAKAGLPRRSPVLGALVATKRPGVVAKAGELVELRARLAEAEDTLRAIRSGEVDAVVVADKQGRHVFTLEGADHAYRVLIESMNEGALTLSADKTVLYANQCFARMVKCPLEQVLGSSFRRFLSNADQLALGLLLKRPDKSGSKIQVGLKAGDGLRRPAQISVRALAHQGGDAATIGMVVTDMTEARRTEEMLRTLTHRVVQAQEEERGQVALELHDHITQLLCAVLFRSQALAEKFSSHDGPAKQEVEELRELLGTTAGEVERISRNLRPGILDQLGLVAALRETTTEFAARTGLPVDVVCVALNARLPADTELALYRILQQALNNVATHAHAHHVVVALTRPGSFVRLTIKDDGVGFDPERRPRGRNGKESGVGLLGLRERAAYVGGSLRIKSALRAGTEIDVRIPVSSATAPHNAANGKSPRSRRAAGN